MSEQSTVHEFDDQGLVGLFHDALQLSEAQAVIAPPEWMEGDFPYQPGTFVGHGGSGFVWKASHRESSQVVALKLIPFESDIEIARERWLREAEIAAAVKHPNLLSIYQKGLSPDGQSAWLALEWIEGADLHRTLKEEGAFSWETLRTWIPDLCSALGILHQDGLVHRDLKPSNLLLEKASNRLVISDFGAALSIEQDRVTRTTDALVSFGYAAPEQLRSSREIDGRADQYSLATTLWELLTDEIPMGSYPKLRRKAPDSPRWLDAVLRRAMSASPDDRYPDIESFAHALTGGPSRRRFYQNAVATTIALAGAGWGISRLVPEPEILTQKDFKSGSVRVVEGINVYVQLDVNIQPDGLVKIIVVTRSDERWRGMRTQAAFALLDAEGKAHLVIVCSKFAVTGQIRPGNGSSRSDYMESQIDPALFSKITDLRFMAHPGDDQPNSPWYLELPDVPKQDARSLIDIIHRENASKK